MPYLKRLYRLQEELKKFSCEALLIENVIDIFYLTGLDLSAGKLFVSSLGASLFIDARYFEICKKKSPYPIFELTSDCLHKHLLSREFSISTLGFDSQKISYKSQTILQLMVEELNKNTSRSQKLSLVPIDNPLLPLRSIKDSDEIDILREAAELGSKGFDFLCKILKNGISEIEAAVELEIFWKRFGGRNVAFEPIIAFGSNSSMPHHRASTQVLREGDLILIDIGVAYRHYHSDMTRIAFLGAIDSRFSEIHSIVLQAQQIALAHCRPGVLVGDIDARARECISSHGYGENFTHSLGHGVGLEIHEFPILKNASPFKETALKPGMVITIEPGIYLPGIGGVRLEDTIVITDSGYENLTNRKHEPFVICK